MQKHLPEERRFTLGDLVEQLDDKGKELGLIIDLTNTDRYYKPAVSFLLLCNKHDMYSFLLLQDIADAQIQYHKMMTPGHNQIPNEACYQQFVDVVQKFLEQNKHNGNMMKTRKIHDVDIVLQIN